MVVKWSVLIAVLLSICAISLFVFMARFHIEKDESTKEHARSMSSANVVHGKSSAKFPKEKLEVCRAPECVKVAARIEKALNTSVEPCEDFYRFSCEGWMKRNPIPKSYNDYSTFTKVSQDIETQLHELLKKHDKFLDDENNTAYEALRKAKDFYQSCMDEEEIEKLGPKPALNFIHEIGSWSLAKDGSWNKSKWDPYAVLRNLHRSLFPAPPFFSVEVTNDHLNSTKHLIKIDQSGLSLQRDIYFKHQKLLDIYIDYMAEVATNLGIKHNAKKKMKKIMNFECELAKVTTSAEEKAEGIYRRMKLHRLKKLVPEFPWLKHMRSIFGHSTNITDADVLLVTTPSYLRSISGIIKRTSKELLSNYIVWQMIRAKISLLSKPFRKARARFNERISGVKDTDPRWRICTSLTNDNMGVPIGTLYIRDYFKEIIRNKTAVMIEEIKKTFKDRVKKHDWIDANTTQHVFEKTDALRYKIGYAKYIVRPKQLRKRFSKLHISPKELFQNSLNVDKWVKTRLFQKLRKPVDKQKWPMFPQTINAMYQFYENEIVIPAGILQAPFYYSGEVPRSLSYGAIGSIIGHELTHGFDNTGRKFDKNGDIVQEWWSKSSLKEFSKRAECIEKQYSKYKIQDKYSLSGKVTLGENIADNGGTKLSYFAYEDWLKKNGPEPVLPSLPYTNQQLFFIGYAQEYCNNARPKTEYISSLSEIHSPPKFRVTGTLSNFDKFADAFNCPLGSPMNPKKKCEVW